MKLLSSFFFKPFLFFSPQYEPLQEVIPTTTLLPDPVCHATSLESKHARIWVSDMMPEEQRRFKTESPSYFESIVYNQCEVTNFNTIPLQTSNESYSPPQYRIYEHPVWSNWNAIWTEEPLILNPDLFPSPDLEEKCHGAQFQIRPSFSYTIFGIPPICQGMTFVFKNFVDPNIRYIVEWCQWTDNKYTYLKVVGVCISGHPYPYNDPCHPSFILRVPLKNAVTPFPPLMLERMDRQSTNKIAERSASEEDSQHSLRTKIKPSTWIDRSIKTVRDCLGQ